MRRVFPLILVLILIGGLAALNQGMQKNVSGDGDDDQQKTQPAKPPASRPPAPSPTPSDDQPLPAEITVGNRATAKYKVTLGWTYDPAIAANQQQAELIFQALQGWAHSRPNAFLEVVDLDVPKSELSSNAVAVPSPGLNLNGTPLILNSHVNDMIASGPAAIGYIMSTLTSKTRN